MYFNFHLNLHAFQDYNFKLLIAEFSFTSSQYYLVK
jgi:hypothetical protein